jgi:hypothetical protein
MNRRTIYAVQAAYYVATGVWPLISMRSFTAVTGPKTDVWLVKMVASLIVVNGASIGIAAVDRSQSRAAFALASGSAVAFTAIDVVYAARRTISPLYLADAVFELALLAALAASK